MAGSVFKQKKMEMAGIEIAGFHMRQFILDFIEKRLENGSQAIGQVIGRLA
jgi:hypothetical protein